jgi:ubiquinone/menaquinone biosynthesis C-methylase UbiE
MLPLNIEFGIDISYSMLKQSGIKNKALQADSVKLPFENNVFNTVLLTTTICFLQKPDISLSEIYRVLKNKGQVIIGFVNKNSVLGKKYQIKKNKSMFYKNAVFYSTEEVLSLLENNKFKDFEVKQTLFESEEFDRIEHGYDKGSFVVVKAYKNEE